MKQDTNPLLRTFVFKFPNHPGRVTVEERNDRIVIKTFLLGAGKARQSDFEQSEKWILPILKPYDTDPRPLVYVNDYDETETIVYGDENNSEFCSITKIT